MIPVDMLFNWDDVLGSTADGGELRVDLGDIRDGVGIAAEAAVVGTDGFVARPNDAADGECARSLYFTDGDEKIIIGTVDARYADKVGTLEPGDRAIFSKGEQRILLKQSNESVSMYTVNKQTNSSMLISASGEDGTITIVNGNALITMEDDKIIMAINGGGYLEINKDGIALRGKSFYAQCGKGHLGLVPPVVPAINGLYYGLPDTGPRAIAMVPSLGWTVDP